VPSPSSRAEERQVDAIADHVEKRHAEREALVVLIGNPNTGKSTLFNKLTGARARVGNYPGITVERHSGSRCLPNGRRVELIDLPGCYSLAARSREEQIALEGVLGLDGNATPDLAVVVVDATQLVRNLYLVVQLIELEVPLLVALNMIDEVDERPDCDALAELLGVPVVALAARRGEGIDELTAARASARARPLADRAGRVDIAYPAPLLADAEAIAAVVPESWGRGMPGRTRALALWALSSIEPDDELAHIEPALRARTLALEAAHGRDIDAEIITARYAFLDARVAPIAAPRAKPAGPTRAQRLTDRVDRAVLHPLWGFAIFVAVMLVLFQSLFSWAEPAIGLIEDAFGWLAQAAREALPEGVLTDLLVQGVIGGVGNVVVFLPQILLLFLLLGLLEDSGYMARAAYLMDRVMKALGLHGRAFVPMLSGCACAIPAIMATRTMERERDRLLTMLVIPLMTCSARLPVYTLIVAALFPPVDVLGFLPVQALLLVGMYVFSTVMALVAAGVLGRTVVRGRRMPLLLELPPYRLPTVGAVARQTLERALVFLKEAGTMILAFTVLMWALLSFPKATLTGDAGADDGQAKATQIEQSYGGRLGKAIEPAIEPLGFDWKLGVGIIGAFAAREVFVSTMGVVYGIGDDADEASAPLREKIRADRRADGRPVYTPLVGLSLMVFFALACQCMSTLAVVRRETRSWRWPAFLMGYMTALAWAASFLVYQGGRLLGLG
jgi:ferrous iron transport protein B